LNDVYVVAINPQEAYQMVRDDRDKRDFKKDREMKAIELIAEDVLYPKCEVRFYNGDLNGNLIHKT
jgi:uncharacterized FlgJ-related protein